MYDSVSGSNEGSFTFGFGRKEKKEQERKNLDLPLYHVGKLENWRIGRRVYLHRVLYDRAQLR